MIALVLAVAISLLTGWLLTRLWWPQPADDHTSLVLRIAVAAGIGLFASSLLTFTCLVLGIAQRPVIIGLDLAFLAVIAHVARKRDNATTFVPRAMRKLSSLDWVLGLGLVSALGIRASAWLARFDAQPLGFWDAFAIWNLKARFFFFAGGDHWIRAFSDAIVWSHTDYPILLPLNVARLWFYIGSPSQSASGLLSVVFVLLGVALLFGAIARPCGRTLAFGATFALLATPALMRQSVWQIADIPLSFYLSASLALVLAAGRCSRPNANLLMLAGLLAGCAAWTKNEGNLFAIAITVSIALVGVGNHFRDRATLALHFARGLALPLLVVAFMKISFAGESDLVTDFGADSLGRTLEFERHAMIVVSFVRSLLSLAGIPLLAVLTALAVAARFRATMQPGRMVAAATLALALQLAGDYGVYLVTDRDLAWHLGTSNLRLLVQLWPSALLLIFTSLETSDANP